MEYTVKFLPKEGTVRTVSKIPISEERKFVEIMAHNLNSRCATLGYTSEHDISDKIGMSRSTYHSRRDHPESWRMIEFARAAIALGTTLEWLCGDHSKECQDRE